MQFPLIFEALKIMLFGMLGIFVVMGIIIIVIKILQMFTGKSKKADK